MISSESWTIVALRALTALARATRSSRIDSTIPSVCLGTVVAVPASAKRAAISASTGSLLPRRRRVWACGWLTSTTTMPCSCR
jgi:hypothetical protein